MRLFNDNGSVYTRNRRRPCQKDLYHFRCKTFFRALHYEVAFRVDGPDEWFPALVEVARSSFVCAEFALGCEALFFEKGVEWCGVVSGAPWYEFVGGS